MTKPSATITVPEVMDQFVDYLRKPGNGNGGSLHIVLADENIQNCHIEACAETAMDADDFDGIDLVNILFQLSKTQRLKIAREVWSLVNQPAHRDIA